MNTSGRRRPARAVQRGVEIGESPGGEVVEHADHRNPVRRPRGDKFRHAPD
jgi:hypothetical protein